MLAGCTPWPANLAEQYRQAGYWRGRTLAEVLDDWADAYGEREAVVSGEQRISYRELRQAVPSLRLVLVAGSDAGPGAISFAELLADPIEQCEPVEQLAAFRPDPADVALFLLSGGTTGLPKLIPRTHEDYEYNARAS